MTEASVTTFPSNPLGGEVVEEVLDLPPEAAARYLDSHDRVHADVIRHAHGSGLLGRMI